MSALAVQPPLRGFLASTGVSPQIRVEFQYNPAQLTDKRTVTYATLGAPGRLVPIRQYTQGGERTIGFSVRVDGLFAESDPVPIALGPDRSIAPELDKYRAFMWPASAAWDRAGVSWTSLYGPDERFASPPLCRFGFGVGGGGKTRVLDVIVAEVSVQEILFNHDLAPTRADVSVTLVELAPDDRPEGPDSARRA